VRSSRRLLARCRSSASSLSRSAASTPVEASGIGAGLVIVLALIRRKLSWEAFRTTSVETLKTSAMLYFIVISANVLNPFFAMTQVPQFLGGGLASMGLGAYETLGAIPVIYIVLGIVYPIILQLGFDPIRFGVVLVIVVQMGLVAPPVGFNVFVVQRRPGCAPPHHLPGSGAVPPRHDRGADVDHRIPADRTRHSELDVWRIAGEQHPLLAQDGPCETPLLQSGSYPNSPLCRCSQAKAPSTGTKSWEQMIWTPRDCTSVLSLARLARAVRGLWS